VSFATAQLVWLASVHVTIVLLLRPVPLSSWAFDGTFLCRILGLSKGWKKLYCALVPFFPQVGSEASELQLLFIDEQALTLVDKVWVTECRSEPCVTRARLHIDVVRYLCIWHIMRCWLH